MDKEMQTALILGAGGAGLFFIWRERQKDQMRRYRIGGRFAWTIFAFDFVMNFLIGAFAAYLSWIAFDTEALKDYRPYREVISLVGAVAGPMVMPMLMELLLEEVEAMINKRRKER